MSAKQSILKALSPHLLSRLKRVLVSLAPLFLREDDLLAKTLRFYGFHPALCAHPSILFGFQRQNSIRVRFVKQKVSFLKRCIRIGLLKEGKGHDLMRETGIREYYGNGKDFWFVETHSPIVLYSVPGASKPLGRVAVYTVLTGAYDNVHEILYKEDGVDYFLFTNNPSLTSETWMVIYVESSLEDVILSREIKMLPHKYLKEEYEVSVYVDANAAIYGEISELTRYLGNGASFAVTRHSIRKSVKEEMEACIKLRGTDRAKAEMQYERYLQEGFVDDRPLLECGLLVRAHHDRMLQDLMQLWFEEFKNGVHRDQLSLLPCMNKLGFENYTVMDGSIWHNQFIRILRHKQN